MNGCNYGQELRFGLYCPQSGPSNQVHNSWRLITKVVFNLIKPTGHVIHHQFNIQQLYALPTLYLCGLYLSENKQRLVPFTA